MTSIFAGRASTSSISRRPRKPISTPASATRARRSRSPHPPARLGPAGADLHARQRDSARRSRSPRPPAREGAGIRAAVRGGEEGDDGGAGQRGGCITGQERGASVAERMEGGTAGADPMMAARGADQRREAGIREPSKLGWRRAMATGGWR
jgi:hypothetical protein